MIHKQFMSIQFLFVVQLLFSNSLQATQTLSGDRSAAAGTTFSFPIQANVSSPDGSSYYVAAHPSVGNPLDFTVSRIYFDGTQFVPLTPEFVDLNNVQGVADPLYNKHIMHMGLLSGLEDRVVNSSRVEHPIVVTTQDPTSVYVIDTFFKRNGGAVESALGIKDADGAVTSGIVGLGNMSNVYAIAAAKPNAGGSFGGAGSGLGVIYLDSKTTTTDNTKVTTRVFTQIGTLPLDISSSILKIQNDAASFSNTVCMHWDESLALLYIGLQVTAGGSAGDGCRAVAVLSEPAPQQYLLRSIAGAEVFTAGQQNEIIGAINPSAQISIQRIKTMHTSTNFSYLIVQGGNGSASTTTQKVYALPLVSDTSNQANKGVIADKNEVPNLIKGGFVSPATSPAEMTIASDIAAQVGGGSVPAGAVSDMFVRGDTVFVTVFDAAVNQLPGLFYSQAIFNTNGTIRAWTSWKRAAGSVDQTTGLVDKVFGATFDTHGDFTTITGTGVDALFTVKRTVWGTDDKDGLLGGTTQNDALGLIQMISGQLPVENAGVQGIVNLPPATPGLGRTSLLVITGFNKVCLVETGVVNAGVLSFNYGDFFTNSVSYTNGTIEQNLPIATPTRVVSISGGALDNIGPITCAEIAADMSGSDAMAWLAVGGKGGLALLAATNGDGWNASTGLGPNFSGLMQGMRFVQVGDYSFVRKLLCDSNLLYVLTDKRLDVIDLISSNFASGTIVSYTLATLDAVGLQNDDCFTDVIVSNKCAMLATSRGLLRVGNGQDIRQAKAPYDAVWTQVPLAQSVGPVTQLFPVTSSGRVQDFATGSGSNVYALNAYVGSNSAQLARYAVAGVATSSIDNTTIEQILNSYANILKPGVPIQAPLVFYTGFRDIFATDGAIFFNAISRNLQAEPFVNMVVGMYRGYQGNNVGTFQIPLSISTASHITQIMRNVASGCWLVAGDFGLRVNE
jgi:hypothetical protein